MISNEAKFLCESDRIEGITIKTHAYDKALQRIKEDKEAKFYSDNHCKALMYVLENKDRLPSIGDILTLHGILMKGYDYATPGIFRTEDVYVGGQLCPKAVSVPFMVDELLFKISQDASDELWIHSQYEVIHPFFDGNGRSGRLLWLWVWLHNGKKLEKTFLSTYFGGPFKEQRESYYDFLKNFRKDSNWRANVI